MTQPVVHRFPCLKDNYGFLLHDPVSGETVGAEEPDWLQVRDLGRRVGWLKRDQVVLLANLKQVRAQGKP